MSALQKLYLMIWVCKDEYFQKWENTKYFTINLHLLVLLGIYYLNRNRIKMQLLLKLTLRIMIVIWSSSIDNQVLVNIWICNLVNPGDWKGNLMLLHGSNRLAKSTASTWNSKLSEGAIGILLKFELALDPDDHWRGSLSSSLSATGKLGVRPAANWISACSNSPGLWRLTRTSPAKRFTSAVFVERHLHTSLYSGLQEKSHWAEPSESDWAEPFDECFSNVQRNRFSSTWHTPAKCCSDGMSITI